MRVFPLLLLTALIGGCGSGGDAPDPSAESTAPADKLEQQLRQGRIQFDGALVTTIEAGVLAKDLQDVIQGEELDAWPEIEDHIDAAGDILAELVPIPESSLAQQNYAMADNTRLDMIDAIIEAHMELMIAFHQVDSLAEDSPARLDPLADLLSLASDDAAAAITALGGKLETD
jgi:hypothetical protein